MALGVTLESADDAKDQKKASSFLPGPLELSWEWLGWGQGKGEIDRAD